MQEHFLCGNHQSFDESTTEYYEAFGLIPDTQVSLYGEDKFITSSKIKCYGTNKF